MRRTILLSLFALLAVSAANDACAQRRGGAGPGFARGRLRFQPRPGRLAPRGLGYAYLPYDSGYAYPPYDSGAAYAYAPQPVLFVRQPPPFVQPPAPPVVEPPGHPVVTDYKWPAVGAGSSPPHSRQPPSPSHGSLPLSSKTVRPSPP